MVDAVLGDGGNIEWRLDCRDYTVLEDEGQFNKFMRFAQSYCLLCNFVAILILE